MSKKKRNQKVSSKSQKEKKEEEIDMSEYEGYEEEKADESEIDYEEYELPEDFQPPEKEEIAEADMNWFQKRMKGIKELEDSQRLYWIKILAGCIVGTILGLAGAQTGWWLFLMIGGYAGITAGGYFLFKLEWNFKEVIFNGFFSYLALFTLFWVLMFTSLYAPTIVEWLAVLQETITTTIPPEGGTEVTTVIGRSTTAAGLPFLSAIVGILSSLGLLTFIVRRRKRRNQ
jgi:hypothetical protein